MPITHALVSGGGLLLLLSSSSFCAGDQRGWPEGIQQSLQKIFFLRFLRVNERPGINSNPESVETHTPSLFLVTCSVGNGLHSFPVHVVCVCAVPMGF